MSAKTVATVLIAALMAAGSLFIDTFIFKNNDRVDQISSELELINDDIMHINRDLTACRERYQRSIVAVKDIEIELKEHKAGNSALRDKVWEFQAKKNEVDDNQTKLIEKCLQLTQPYMWK